MVNDIRLNEIWFVKVSEDTNISKDYGFYKSLYDNKLIRYYKNSKTNHVCIIECKNYRVIAEGTLIEKYVNAMGKLVMRIKIESVVL
jgi:hypothetical protein